MFRHSLVLGLLLLGSASLRADFKGVLDESQHDFGVVPRGQQLTHYFRVANPTNQTLRITGVRVSCGCTSARALEQTIPPGRETAIYAVMDSSRFVGPKQVMIYVTFDQPRYEELRTAVVANAREDLIFSPHHINFGKVKAGDAKTASMNLTMYSGAAQILEVKSDSNYIQPSAKEIRRTAGEATYQVEAKVRNDTPVGLWFTDVWVKTNNPGYAKLRVPVMVEVEGLQPAKNEEKKVEGTKTSFVNPARNPAQTQTQEPPLASQPGQAAQATEQPRASTPPSTTPPVSTSERAPMFPILSNFFRGGR